MNPNALGHTAANSESIVQYAVYVTDIGEAFVEEEQGESLTVELHWSPNNSIFPFHHERSQMGTCA